MSESTRFKESPTAQQLADTLRTGYEMRQRERGRNDDLVTANLRVLGDIESIPPVAKPGWTSGPMKLGRAVLRAFLRPWIAVQTNVNQEVATRLHELTTMIRDVQRRTPVLEAGMRHLEGRVLHMETASSGPVARHDVPAESGSLERMFVHMQLSSPPTRILMLGATATMPELAAFGYEVSHTAHGTSAAADAVSPNGPSTSPWPDASFDVVVRVSGAGSVPIHEPSISEIARVLKPGGRVIATGTRRDLDALLRVTAVGQFRVRTLMSGIVDGGTWRVSAIADGAGALDARPSAALVLLCVERDESHR